MANKVALISYSGGLVMGILAAAAAKDPQQRTAALESVKKSLKGIQNAAKQ